MFTISNTATLIFLITGFLCIHGVEISPSTSTCRPNEELKWGSNCPPTCGPPPQMCTMVIKRACFCKERYVRQSSDLGSPCILSDDCNKRQCGENEQWTWGSVCPPTCDPTPVSCIAVAKQGCFCNKGYVRQPKLPGNPCVREEACNCASDEEYAECGSACPPSCADLKNPEGPKMCTMQCVAGCFCKERLYRSDDGKCVLASQC